MKRIITIIACTALVLSASAQQEVMISQYMFNRLFIDPAYAGVNNHFTSTLLHRTQWTQVDGAPVTSMLGADAAIMNGKLGIGGTVIHDKIGATKDVEMAAHIAYHLRLANENSLSFGLKAGMSMYSASLSGLTVWDIDDPAFQNDVYNANVGKFGFGVLWKSERSYVGVSIPTLYAQSNNIAEQIAGGDGKLFDQHYYFSAGHVVKINERLDLKPSVLVKYEDAAPVDVDVNLNMLYNERIWFGLGWRHGDALIAMLEYQVIPSLRLGYAYDMTTSALRNYSNGSHEVMLGYDMAREQVRLKSPRYF